MQRTMSVLSKPFIKSLRLGQVLTLATIVLAGSSIIKFQIIRLGHLDSHTQSKQSYQLEEQKTQDSLKVLSKLPKLGYENLIADYMFLNFIQYFGDEDARGKTGFRVSPDFFDIIVKRDPLFFDVYPYLSSSVTLFAGKPQKSVSLLTQGAAAVPPKLQPQAYFLWQYKAADELLFLGDTAAAQRSYEMASKWAGQSTDPALQEIALHSRQTAQFLASNPDSRRARVGSWFDILSNAIDDPTRQFAAKQIQALGGEIINRNGAFQVKMPKRD
jgi:hypothetical protein